MHVTFEIPAMKTKCNHCHCPKGIKVQWFQVLRLFWDLKNALGSQNVLDKVVDIVDIVDTVDIIESVHAVVMVDIVDIVDIVDVVDIVWWIFSKPDK